MFARRHSYSVGRSVGRWGVCLPGGTAAVRPRPAGAADGRGRPPHRAPLGVAAPSPAGHVAGVDRGRPRPRRTDGRRDRQTGESRVTSSSFQGMRERSAKMTVSFS